MLTMKRLINSAVAAIVLGASLTSGAVAQPYNRDQSRQDPGRNAYDQRQGDEARRDDEHRSRRQQWRETRQGARWDNNQHNGYYVKNRWHVGQPPERYYGRDGFSPGYRPWVRGQRLGYYNNRYSEVDYRSANLRQPRRGYHWVRDDQGNYLLAAIASGIIASVILNGD